MSTSSFAQQKGVLREEPRPTLSEMERQDLLNKTPTELPRDIAIQIVQAALDSGKYLSWSSNTQKIRTAVPDFFPQEQEADQYTKHSLNVILVQGKIKPSWHKEVIVIPNSGSIKRVPLQKFLFFKTLICFFLAGLSAGALSKAGDLTFGCGVCLFLVILLLGGLIQGFVDLFALRQAAGIYFTGIVIIFFGSLLLIRSAIAALTNEEN